MEQKKSIVRYFDRIGLSYDGSYGKQGGNTEETMRLSSKTALERLCEVVYHHALSIPFENFNSATGRTVAIDLDGIYDKLVLNRRGGYCFEQNSLMHFVLGELGYAHRRCLGRVLLGGEPSALAHLVNVVTIDDQQYLVDLGFGGKSPRLPLLLQFDAVQVVGTEMYRFQRDVDEFVAPGGYRLQYFDWEGYSKDLEAQSTEELEDYWRNQYAFSFVKVWDSDIRAANFAVNFNTASTNMFTNARVVSLLTRDGRKTVFHDTFTVYKRLATPDIDAMKQCSDITVVELPYSNFATNGAAHDEQLAGFERFGGMMGVRSSDVDAEQYIDRLEMEFNIDLAADGITMESFLPGVLGAARKANQEN